MGLARLPSASRQVPSGRLAVCAVAACALLAGCDERLVLKADCADRGLVIVLPGIDGGTGYSLAACDALSRSGPDMAVELYDWTVPFGGLLNQTAIGRNRDVARRLARRIADYQRRHPGRPVYLIGHSGGTAIAVWAAEAAGSDGGIQRLVLLASSLSPTYSLRQALANSREGIVSFYSPHDAALLGFGTSLIGTMDGQHCESAGKVGFRDELSAGLMQVCWREEMAKAGHWGGHLDYMSPKFLAAYVVPLLRPYEAAGDADGDGEGLDGETLAGGGATEP